jgi:hypothetical protein
MAVTHTPIFVQTPKIGKAAIAAANTARDGSGTIVTAFTAGSNGSYIKRVTFTSSQATAAASSAMVVRIWISTDAGTSWTLKTEIAVATVTSSNTVIGSIGLYEPSAGLQIDAGALIGVTQSVYAGVQDRMAVVVEGADY